jgi:hypothetical protein
MGKKTPSTSRKQLRSAAPYVAKSVDPPSPPVPVPVPVPAPAPVPLPTAAPLLEHPTGPILPTFDLRALARTALGFAEAALATLPAPSEILLGADPTVPSPPPGPVPAGDSRSMRQGEHFALVYRHGASVVSRRGLIGQRGTWRVVDYPGPAQASHAYATECSKLRDQGFVDLS